MVIRHHSLMVEENSVTHTAGAVGGDSSRPWQTLASGFEQARAREDSLDRLVEWPAQRAFLGDVAGLAVLAVDPGSLRMDHPTWPVTIPPCTSDPRLSKTLRR